MQVIVYQHRAALVVEDAVMGLPVAARPVQVVELHASLLDEFALEMLELRVQEGAIRREALVETYHAEALEAQLVQAMGGAAELPDECPHVDVGERVEWESVFQEFAGSARHHEHLKGAALEEVVRQSLDDRQTALVEWACMCSCKARVWQLLVGPVGHEAVGRKEAAVAPAANLHDDGRTYVHFVDNSSVPPQKLIAAYIPEAQRVQRCNHRFGTDLWVHYWQYCSGVVFMRIPLFK